MHPATAPPAAAGEAGAWAAPGEPRAGALAMEASAAAAIAAGEAGAIVATQQPAAVMRPAGGNGAGAAPAAWYPVFLDLRGRRCVVVGGGAMAADKARELGAAGARVTVVAARPGPAVEAMSRGGQVRLRRRRFRDGDLAGAWLAIAAGDDDAEREDVRREAWRRRLPFNSVDDLPRCSFIAGAVVRRGALTVAISTGGRAPALAVRLRQWLERRLGAEHARFLDLAGPVRAALAARVADAARRRELWYALVDSDALALLRRDDEAAARRRFAEILGVEPPALPAAEGDPAHPPDPTATTMATSAAPQETR